MRKRSKKEENVRFPTNILREPFQVLAQKNNLHAGVKEEGSGLPCILSVPRWISFIFGADGSQSSRLGQQSATRRE